MRSAYAVEGSLSLGCHRGLVEEFPDEIGAPFQIACYSACFVIFSSTPTHASVTNSDDPPYDTSGSGIPFVGIIPSTTLILMNACSTTILVIPTARYLPKTSSVRHEARIPRHRKIANSVTTNIAPTNPNSSAVTAKIKSVCGSGR